MGKSHHRSLLINAQGRETSVLLYRCPNRCLSVDEYGVCESDKTDSRPLERKKTVPFDKRLLGLTPGKRHEDRIPSLAGRLARLDRAITRGKAHQLFGAELTGSLDAFNKMPAV